MARSYHLAPSLVKLRTEINLRWPGRSKSSDGWIGDAAHSARASDHNPNSRGSVNALDVTARGINTSTLINATVGDSRVNYVIYNRQIWSRSYNWKVRRYTGSNPHATHVHISLLQSRTAEQNTSSWGVATSPSLPNTGVTNPTAPTPTPKPNPIKEEDMPLNDADKKFITDAIFKGRRDLQGEGFDRKGYDILLEQIFKYTTVKRSKDGQTINVPLLQDLADGTSLAASNQVVLARLMGRIEALQAAFSGAATGGEIDMQAVEAAAERGTARALDDMKLSVSIESQTHLATGDEVK